MFRLVSSAAFALAALTGQSAAQDIRSLANAWEVFLAECQQVLESPLSYIDALAPLGPEGQPTKSVSPDGAVVAFTKRIGSGYVEGDIQRLPDREVRSCAYILEVLPFWNSAQVASQYVAWIRQSPEFVIAGGYTFLYETTTYRHVVLGLLPEYDLPIITHLYDSEFQLFVERTVRLP